MRRMQHHQDLLHAPIGSLLLAAARIEELVSHGVPRLYTASRTYEHTGQIAKLESCNAAMQHEKSFYSYHKSNLTIS